MEERQDYKAFWIAIFILLLCTRLPAMAHYLSIDNVNLALSLEKFDPRIHQPQPPGYPLFVFFARIVNFFVRNEERTFVVISLLVSGLCLPAAYALAKRMFSAWAGIAAALLLLLNPVFWYAGLEGPLRPNLALFSLLTAYCCWRCWNGEKQFAVWSAVALAVGSGFRQDLAAFLLPLWLISTWVGTKSWRTMLKGLGVMAAIAGVWLGALVWAMGGVQTFMKIMLDYAADQSRPESIVLGSSVGAWRRQISRLVVWNGLAAVTWVWAVPFYVRYRERIRLASSHGVFFFIWLVPGLIVQALVHVGAPGHTLHSVVALCVLGGYLLSLVPARDILLGCTLVLNAMLFLDFLPLPDEPANAADRTPSVQNAMVYGTFESSIGEIRWLDEITGTTLKEIAEFTPKDRPSVVITTDAYVKQWFMNWRIGRYYLPHQDFWVLSNDANKRSVQHIRRDVVVETKETSPLRVSVFREGRIIWLIEPESAIHKQLASVQKLNGGKYVFYSDVTADSPAFMLGDFEIAPASFNLLLPNSKSITVLGR